MFFSAHANFLHNLIFGSFLQGSWEQKLIDRLYNVEKKRARLAEGENDESPARKRGRPRKNESGLTSRYPEVNLGETLDMATLQNHMDAVAKELQKTQPRKEVILSLMKSLFPSRRSYILHDASSVVTTLEIYPALKFPYVVRFYCKDAHLCKEQIFNID